MGVYVMREQLYDLAFRYKKARLWKKLWDNEIFAIKLTSGKIGYISIMGKSSEYCALGLYIGEEGFQSFRTMENASRYISSEFVFHEMLIQQNCLQIALENKDDLMTEELEEVRTYAKKHDRRLGGKNAYPQFLKYEPNRIPWKVTAKEDETALLEAMEAAILLAEALQTTKPKLLGIEAINPFTQEVPLFEVKGQQLNQIGFAALPGDKEVTYLPVRAKNDFAIKTVKKLPQKGIWEAEFFRFPEPVQDNDTGKAPYFPLCLFLVERKSDYVIPMLLTMEEEHNPQAMIQQYANSLKEHAVCPVEIRCRDERTHAFLQDFCEKTNIKIELSDEKLQALDEAKADFLNTMMTPDEEDDDFGHILMILDMLFEMDPKEIRSLPKPLLEEINAMTTILPDDLATEIKKKLKGLI